MFLLHYWSLLVSSSLWQWQFIFAHHFFLHFDFPQTALIAFLRLIEETSLNKDTLCTATDWHNIISVSTAKALLASTNMKWGWLSYATAAVCNEYTSSATSRTLNHVSCEKKFIHLFTVAFRYFFIWTLHWGMLYSAFVRPDIYKVKFPSAT